MAATEEKGNSITLILQTLIITLFTEAIWIKQLFGVYTLENNFDTNKLSTISLVGQKEKVDVDIIPMTGDFESSLFWTNPQF